MVSFNQTQFLCVVKWPPFVEWKEVSFQDCVSCPFKPLTNVARGNGTCAPFSLTKETTLISAGCAIWLTTAPASSLHKG